MRLVTIGLRLSPPGDLGLILAALVLDVRRRFGLELHRFFLHSHGQGGPREHVQHDGSVPRNT